jgi:hypothetical protein
MLPFVLYFVAAVVTGFHLYSLLSLIVYGAGFNLLQITALFGSFLLLIAAYVSLFKPRIAAQIALVASLTLWCFYGPALANLVRSKLAKRTTTSQLSAPLFEVPHHGPRYRDAEIRTQDGRPQLVAAQFERASY